VVKIRNIIYDEKSLQQVVSQETTIWLCMNEGTAVLELLNFFNEVINELLAIDVKIDEENKAFILLSSLPESYYHIVTTILYSKKILIL